MNDSNQTLRFSRTAREEFGHDITFDRPDRYRLIWPVAIFIWGFLLGMIVAGVGK